MYTSLEKLSVKGQELVELLCSAAQKGLTQCYSQENLLAKKSGLKKDRPYLSMAWNLRYIIIAQIGIKRWLNSHEYDENNLPDLWEHIRSRSTEIRSAGDLAMATWAAVETGTDDCRIYLTRLVEGWAGLRDECNAVELAWVVQAIVSFSQQETLPDKAAGVLKDAKNRLAGLYCPSGGLFARHNRKGLTEIVSRKVSCFADQVYPIMAMANYGAAFDHEASIAMAAGAADTICRLQGPEGQWWWHYDVQNGAVAEEYPVFTVHQDSMAPMALLAIDAAAGTNHSKNIEKGLMWYAADAMNQAMMMPEDGLIWRDIHRREIPKMYRVVRGLLISGGLRSVHRLTGKSLFGYAVNRECRPYHLGWILYAWSSQAP